MESWRKKLESQATGKGGESLKKLGKISAKGDVYAILKCEGQVKRTALAKGHQNPVWKEDIAFKSVQITSELQVHISNVLLGYAQSSSVLCMWTSSKVAKQREERGCLR